MAEKAGQVNEYQCACGRRWYAMLLADGTTPFMAKCIAADCSSLGQSTCYRLRQVPPNIDIVRVAYRPAELCYDPDLPDEQAVAIRGHLLAGGLLEGDMVDFPDNLPAMAPRWDSNEEDWQAYALRVWDATPE